MEKKGQHILGWYIIGSALIWGITGVAISLQLKGTECFEQIGTFFGLGAAMHLILVWGPLAAKMKKLFPED